MIKHEIFPTLYGEWKFPDHQIFKDQFKKTIFEYIKNNGTTWTQNVKEGDLFVFPGKLKHDNVGFDPETETIVEAFDEDELFQQRICLAGDFIICYRDISSNPTGTQPISNWRVF